MGVLFYQAGIEANSGEKDDKRNWRDPRGEIDLGFPGPPLIYNLQCRFYRRCQYGMDPLWSQDAGNGSENPYT